MTALKPFVGTPDRFAIAQPWLEIKGGHLFLCATNGHTAVVIELLKYQTQIKKQEDGFVVFVPKRLFEKPTIATFDSDSKNWETNFDFDPVAGSPVNIWQIIPKGERSWDGGDFPRFGVNPSYMKDCSNLFEKIFKSQKAPTMIISMGDDNTAPILISDDHTSDEYRVNAIVMPMRL